MGFTVSLRYGRQIKMNGADQRGKVVSVVAVQAGRRTPRRELYSKAKGRARPGNVVDRKVDQAAPGADEVRLDRSPSLKERVAYPSTGRVS